MRKIRLYLDTSVIGYDRRSACTGKRSDYERVLSDDHRKPRSTPISLPQALTDSENPILLKY